jgi:hypothetical protein
MNIIEVKKVWIIHSFNGRYNKVKHCVNCYEDYPIDYEGKCEKCSGVNTVKPYSDEEYEEAKEQGLDLDDWDDYVKYFGIGEVEEYE